MLAGPFTQNFYLCYVLTYFEIATILEFALKGYLIYVIWRSYTHTTPLFYAFVIYLILWFIATYVYYSYTKSLGLGLLPREESQDNSQCMQFIQSSDSGCQVPANTNLRVAQSPTIVLTNPVDVTFVADKQGLIVNNATYLLV
jgi:hypothetical protein